MSSHQAATSTYGLLERFKKGDDTAFSELFKMYASRLAVLIHYRLSPRLRSEVDVEDVVQEVFLAASRDLESFRYRQPGSFMNWLARIAENTVRDIARHANRKKRQASEQVTLGGAEEAGLVQHRETPSRLLAGKEGMERLLGRLEALPDDYREVILLARMEGLTSSEIAVRMNRSRDAVAVLLHRAIQKLRAAEEGR